ncbi:MAG: hypothetical protein A3F11_07410 [Gammaproteobacteria bacterium RIFCSPHIGHO2_12_FULL_37_14]|nr:MAG: hypothetical protein A3F11_07410 [Gammaproteobacteria bacterium RIFCSPHIGHO2_12_FULL_37_14]
MQAGDFTQLANKYSKYRPGYCETVIQAMLGILNKPINQIKFVDVGAGTGIWTRQFFKHGCQTAIAIEPNDAMRTMGIQANEQLNITWLPGSAEYTQLADHCADLVTMASSFHWADFHLATNEFYRILKPQGHFAILWNPRYFENNPLLQEIENHIIQLQPDMKRISSGKSKHVDQLANQLLSCPLFEDRIHIEGFHTVRLAIDEYIGVWESVNDVRSQLGESNFREFIRFVHDKIKGYTAIDCTYQTRAWIFRRK